MSKYYALDNAIYDQVSLKSSSAIELLDPKNPVRTHLNDWTTNAGQAADLLSRRLTAMSKQSRLKFESGYWKKVLSYEQ